MVPTITRRAVTAAAAVAVGLTAIVGQGGYWFALLPPLAYAIGLWAAPVVVFQHRIALQAALSLLLSRAARALRWVAARTAVNHGTPVAGCAEISPVWLTARLREHFPSVLPVKRCVACNFDENRGLSGTVLKFQVFYDEKETAAAAEEKGTAAALGLPKFLMLKRCGDSLQARYESIVSGHYREAAFHALHPELSRRAAGLRVLWGSWNHWLGEWALLSEYVEPSLQLNFVFGNQMWGVPDAARQLLEGHPDAPSQLRAMEAMFDRAALLHASHWCNPTLLDPRGSALGWIKGWQWYAGRGREVWTVGFDSAARGWARRDISAVRFSPRIEAAMDHALKCSSFEEMVRHLRASREPFCLVHGDFHAGNAIWRLLAAPSRGADRGGGGGGLVLVDWSEVGVWQPMADLSQFLISDVHPEIRRLHERHLVELYHRSLLRYHAQRATVPDGPADPRSGGRVRAVEEFSLEECWRLFVRGGVERWLWLLGLLAGMPVPPSFIQYLHDQLLAFIEDHDVPLADMLIRSVGTVEM